MSCVLQHVILSCDFVTAKVQISLELVALTLYPANSAMFLNTSSQLDATLLIIGMVITKHSPPGNRNSSAS
jgi:hypothetical protein